jgi:hypothetical protein
LPNVLQVGKPCRKDIRWSQMELMRAAGFALAAAAIVVGLFLIPEKRVNFLRQSCQRDLP